MAPRERGGISRDLGLLGGFGPSIRRVKTGELVSRKYRLIERLAEGGMGEVWSVRNERTNRDFAIKFLLPELARDPESLHRFVREAKATGQLRHPNVVTAMDAGMHESRPYLVLELLSGESLEMRLKREGHIDELEACILLSQVARALEHAHASALVHRDLSSANVFLCQNHAGGPPLVKVLDFGVSKVLDETPNGRVQTSNGKILGSPIYMSPEQAKGADGVDARTDLWSLGILAYQCLSGVTPFKGANYNALMFAILQSPHESLGNLMPQLDADLAELVENCLIKDREMRSDSARDIATRLEQIAVRLSNESGRSRYVPLRRSVDRIRQTDPGGGHWVARRALSKAALPLGTRMAQRLHSVPSSAMLALGVLVGGASGLAGAKLLVPRELAGISAAPLPKSVCEPAAPGIADRPIPVGQAGPSTAAAKAARNETELVRAFARGLDVPDKPSKSGLPANSRVSTKGE
ncbi:MAG TPA: serine/threonine-protein kinase [Polyangiaceae bacterium]